MVNKLFGEQDIIRCYMNNFFRFFTDPYWSLGVLLHHVLCHFITNDRLYIKLDYLSGMKCFPDLEHPKTFNEKLQWLKLNDKHEEYTMLVDKYAVKNYVKGILGDEVIIPTLGVWDEVEDIAFENLPQQFVLKTTHDSGGIVIVKDKNKLDLKAVKTKLRKSLIHNFYKEHREYPYKNVKPRIIAEKFMVDESGTELKDYKFFCFDGEVKFLFVATDRPYDTRFDFFDKDFNHLPFKQGHPWAKKEIKKPVNFEEMKRIASILSKGIPHVRVDLYNINGRIYFGEMTFFHFAANVPFDPPEWDEEIGKLLKLPCCE